MEALYYREQLSANDVFKKLHTQMFSKSALQYFINTHSNMFKKGALGLSSKFHTQMFLENAHSNVSQNFTLKCFSKLHTQFFHKKKHTHIYCVWKKFMKKGDESQTMCLYNFAILDKWSVRTLLNTTVHLSMAWYVDGRGCMYVRGIRERTLEGTERGKGWEKAIGEVVITKSVNIHGTPPPPPPTFPSDVSQYKWNWACHIAGPFLPTF
jgi:hypothetical protein